MSPVNLILLCSATNYLSIERLLEPQKRNLENKISLLKVIWKLIIFNNLEFLLNNVYSSLLVQKFVCCRIYNAKLGFKINFLRDTSVIRLISWKIFLRGIRVHTMMLVESTWRSMATSDLCPRCLELWRICSLLSGVPADCVLCNNWKLDR